MTSPIWSDCQARARDGFADHDAAQLGGGRLGQRAPNLPTAVRAAETMTMSSMVNLLSG